jgi:hypothetical protein
MTYSRNMGIRIALFAIPALVAIGVVLLLNTLNASAGIAVAIYTVAAMAIGTAIGCNADRLPGTRPSEQTHPPSDTHCN